MNQLDTLKYIKNNLEQITLIGNAIAGSKTIRIENLKSQTYPNMDIILYGDIENFDNPITQMLIPVVVGKINFDGKGTYIELNNPLSMSIPFNAVLYTFSGFNIVRDLKDNEIPCMSDIMNIVENDMDVYDGINLIKKGTPSLITGDMKLRLEKIPYDIELKRVLTKEYQNLFYLNVDNFDKFEKEFTIKIFNESKELDIELNCYLNNTQSVVTSVKNNSVSKYLYTTNFAISKNSYVSVTNENNKICMLSVKARITNIEQENIIVVIRKKHISDITTEVPKLFNSKEKIFFSFDGIKDLVFNKSINFYSTELRRYNIVAGDLFRTAISLPENIDLKTLKESGIYFCSNNYGDKLPIDLPEQLIKSLWYMEVRNYNDTILQTVYDLSDITIILQRKSIGVLEYCDWKNMYHLEHKHKAEDITESDDKMFVPKKSIEKWNNNVDAMKYTNFIAPVDYSAFLPKSTKESIIPDFTLCYVRSLKTYLVYDGKDWINIDDTIIEYTDEINLDTYMMKSTIIFRKENTLVLKSLLNLKYDCSSALVTITGNSDVCFQLIRINDVAGKMHEYIRTYVKSENAYSEYNWQTKEVSFSGHKHETTDIQESEEKFFMTKTDRENIEKLNKKGIGSVNTFLNLPEVKNLEDNVMFRTEDTKIIYSLDKENNIWIPISINNLKSIDNEKQDNYDNIESGLVSKGFYSKLKEKLEAETVSKINQSIVFGNNPENNSLIGECSVDLVLRTKKLMSKMGNNSVAIGNNIYNYRNRSILIGSKLESELVESILIGNGLISTKNILTFGNYNIAGDYAFGIGNGTDLKRSNLFTIGHDGMFQTLETGGYSIINGSPDNVLLADGKNISIYDIYKIIRKLINTEPEDIDTPETVLIENPETGIVEEKIVPESISKSNTFTIFDRLRLKRDNEIANKTFSSF